MVKFLLQRLLFAVVVLFVVMILVFFLIRLVPGDPVEIILGPAYTEQLYNDTKTALGYDKSILVQFGIYLRNVLQGDLGTSMILKQPCALLVSSRFRASVELSVAAVLISLLVSIPIGTIAAVKKGSLMDIGAMTFAILGNAMSPVWTGMILILVFGVTLRWLPTMGYGSFRNIILPAVTLGFGMCASVVRHLRSSMFSTLQEDHVAATKARGVPQMVVYSKFALRNALLPVVTLVGVNFATMLAGSAVVETVFGWPGLGNLLISAITNRDYQLIQACLLMSTVVFVVANLIVDILYSFIDPRVRLH